MCIPRLTSPRNGSCLIPHSCNAVRLRISDASAPGKFFSADGASPVRIHQVEDFLKFLQVLSQSVVSSLSGRQAYRTYRNRTEMISSEEEMYTCCGGYVPQLLSWSFNTLTFFYRSNISGSKHLCQSTLYIYTNHSKHF